jgi:hypothetical protein
VGDAALRELPGVAAAAARTKDAAVAIGDDDPDIGPESFAVDHVSVPKKGF